ncbi:MAG: hypothetical protein ACOYNO_13725 [Saprospiraceae bacterium]
MHKRHLFFLLTFFALMEACEKAAPLTDDFGNPVFQATAQVGDKALDLVAGSANPNVYLFTDYAYDAGKDWLTLSGTFRSVYCTADSCEVYLRFDLRNNVPGNNPVSDSVFTTGSRSFFRSDSLGAQPAVFAAVSNQNNLQLFWDFGDQNAGTGLITTHVYTEPSLPQTVTLYAYDPQKGWNSLYARTLVPLQTDGCPPAFINCMRDINVVQLTATVAGTGPYDYSWSNGDSAASILVPYDTVSYTVTISDPNGGCQWVIQAPGLQNVGADVFQTAYFTYTPQKNAGSAQPETVTISWKDPNNTLWRSDLGSQNGSSFQIIRSEPYELNEQGQKTRLLEVEFSCFLYDGAGNEKPLNGTAILAIAYP